VIVFFTTEEHSYTHRALIGAEPGLKVELVSYSRVAQLRSLAPATYVFTDLDRLPTELLLTCSNLYRQLRTHGLTVLNNPAQVLSRSGLLRALYRKGINRYNAYRLEEGVRPERWPVFLRTEGDHAGPMPELYENEEALDRGIKGAVYRGYPTSRLLIVEYMAEPVRPGLFRKLSCFRIGSASIAHTCVHDSKWIAKTGQLGVTPPDLYDDELRIVRDNPYGPSVAEAFDVAAVDYGRVDFSLVGGGPQIYEINTNPMMSFDDQHHSAVRLEAYRLFKQSYFEALKAIDTPSLPHRDSRAPDIHA
jgi:hypothetical protein